MSSAAAQRQEILRYFYALLLIVVFSMVVLVTAVLPRYLADTRDRKELESFHLRSLTLVGEASHRLAVLERRLDELPSADGSDAAVRQAVVTVRATRDILSVLEAIQRQHGNATGARTLDRAERQYQSLESALESGDLESPLLRTNLEGLGFTFFQLGRLHSVASEALLSDLEARSRRGNRFLTLALSGVILLTAVLVVRTLSLVRASLRRQSRIAEDLLLREQQLQQASKMEALGRLVGGVAHDFNNLLTAILGNAELLRRQHSADAQISARLREITRAGERAAILTRQLLAFSRQEEVEPRIIDLKLLLSDTEPMLRRLLPADISLAVDADSDLYDVESDPIQLEQVVVNLAVNARDAMSEGGSLSIRARNHRVGPGSSDPSAVPAGDYVRMTIEDTGCGMDPEVRAKIFEPFFTTKGPGGGTGLGLSTVHGIVKRGGGHILVESAAGQGSRFDIFLPRARRGAPPAHETDGVSVGASGTGTVLLAEDDEQVRNLAASGLRDAGYQVLEVRDGQEGIQVCEGHDGPIDLIVTDVVMPRLRGPALVERALETYPAARVVYITAYADSEILQEVERSGAPTVRKPFKLERLLEVVADELAQGDPGLRGNGLGG